jgi:hypothetical protein
MHYTVFLASVAADSIERCRTTGAVDLATSMVVSCPHDLVNVEVQPLGAVLAQLIDVGQPLRNDGWHPQRAPVVVDPETAMARSRRLDEAWREALPELGGLMGEVLGGDIDDIRALYAHASANHEWVVSYLSAPEDPALAERAFVPTTSASTAST